MVRPFLRFQEVQEHPGTMVFCDTLQVFFGDRVEPE